MRAYSKKQKEVKPMKYEFDFTEILARKEDAIKRQAELQKETEEKCQKRGILTPLLCSVQASYSFQKVQKIGVLNLENPE